MKRIVVIFVFLFSCLIFFANDLYAQTDSLKIQTDSLGLYDLSLDDLIKLKAHGVPTELESLVNTLISAASKKPLNVLESPNIISLITEEDIANSGARDIMDVLRLVPGIDFGTDVDGFVGIGMRGNWAVEGKVLILLDGQEFNETLYGSVAFGNHLPVEQIKKIEVIRGPGSAIYGGYAEYGVINIITRQGNDLNGVHVSANYGQFETANARKSINLAVGKKINDFSFSLSAMSSDAQRSILNYTDFNGNSVSMKKNSALTNNYFNFHTDYKGLSFRLIGDFYNITNFTGYGIVNPFQVVTIKNQGYYAELKKEFVISDKFKVTPRVNYKTQKPWLTPEFLGEPEYNKTAERTLQNITASYAYNRKINFDFGVESYQDKATDNTPNGYFLNNQKTLSYFNLSAFSQGLLKTRLVNITLGARYDRHNAYGKAFVPRIGLTKKVDKFFFKALYSGGFRSPTIENINFADPLKGIKPEFTFVSEFETGYQLSKYSLVSINLYDISTHQPIVYYVSSDTSGISTDNYINTGHSGTQGIEVEYKFKNDRSSFFINYAYYAASNKNKIDEYKTPSPFSLLGFANHRVNLNSSIKLGKSFTANTTASYIGKRYYVSGYDKNGETIFSQFNPNVLINLYFSYRTPLNGLTAGVGVYDLLNEHPPFIQPYDGGHATLPNSGREFIVRLNYKFNTGK